MENKDKYKRIGNERTNIIYDTETNFFKSVSYFDENGNGYVLEYDKNELKKRIECIKDSDGNIIKHGKAEFYKDGKVIKMGGYKDGREHGEWVEVDLNSLKINRKCFDSGRDITKDVPLSVRGVEVLEEITNTMLERNPERALKNFFNVIINDLKNKKPKIPQIKVNFEKDPKIPVGEEINGYISFYDDGSPKIICERAENRNGKIILKGNYIEHYDNCFIKERGQFDENGNKIGEWFKYNEKGELIKEEKNINNNILKKHTITINKKPKTKIKDLGIEREKTI